MRDIHAKQGAKARIPLPPRKVEHLRSGGIRAVGGVDHAAGKIPDQPAIHRTNADIRHTRAVVLQQPCRLGRWEHRIERQAGFRDDLRLVPCPLERVTGIGGAATLPRHHGAKWFTGAAIPDQDRFALVRDAERDDPGIGRLRATCRNRGERGGPDFGGILLHPARPGMRNRHGGRAAGDDRARLVHEDGLRVRSALVDCQNDLACHGLSLAFYQLHGAFGDALR